MDNYPNKLIKIAPDYGFKIKETSKNTYKIYRITKQDDITLSVWTLFGILLYGFLIIFPFFLITDFGQTSLNEINWITYFPSDPWIAVVYAIWMAGFLILRFLIRHFISTYHWILKISHQKLSIYKTLRTEIISTSHPLIVMHNSGKQAIISDGNK